MSYEPGDDAFGEMYERISEELYPEHKEQAVTEFTAERLQLFYLSNPMVMRPAVDSLQEGKRLLANGHSPAAVVFCATAIELLLKATVLQPIVYGLVHSAGLAEIIVKYAVGQTGFDRYRELLSRLYQELASLDLTKVARDGVSNSLIDESKRVQELRNGIIHKGLSCSTSEADHAYSVAVAVFQKIVVPMLWAIGLTVGDKGRIERRPIA
ncbi:hypothetical protein [Cupriavidus necator]|uniref:hypothetical protein n=1 Tax=Cupriavidus necator TaxID=106590 RepID=UPI00339D5960